MTSTEFSLGRKVDLEPGWYKAVEAEFSKPYFEQLRIFLLNKKAQNITVYPAGSLMFNAFRLTPFERVKVVILGQDPYHGPGQAHGLCFSVPEGVKAPPSLKNIFKEIEADLGLRVGNHTDLSKWAQQGVLLLNTILSVDEGRPGSHKSSGWEQFTDEVIKTVSEDREAVVFMLWGSYARSKKQLIDQNKHLVLEAQHPSPLSVRGFLGCRHFSKANEWLQGKGLSAIDWMPGSV